MNNDTLEQISELIRNIGLKVNDINLKAKCIDCLELLKNLRSDENE